MFSGSISYVLSELAKGTRLSSAIEAAHGLGLLEPDPRDDLEGLDVRRKVVVLARELGLRLELADVVCDSLLPAPLLKWKPNTNRGAPSVATQLVEALKPYDDEVAARISSLSQPDHALVQLSVVDIVDEGKAEVKLAAVPLSDRISSYEANENIVEITTQRYSPRPMILQGPGAGAEITASGLFADLLKLSRTLIEWNIPQII